MAEVKTAGAAGVTEEVFVYERGEGSWRVHWGGSLYDVCLSSYKMAKTRRL